MGKHSTLPYPLPLYRYQRVRVLDRNWDGAQPEITTRIHSGEEAMAFVREVARELNKSVAARLDIALAHLMSGERREHHSDFEMVTDATERWTFELSVISA